ncbi:hypothetical protein [Paenibacillus polymyxa]|uniref:hypothetical protein n=1 Tax=Paenibacillus polymyxa TaxID=1406 RepID=UPI0020245A38|nr:hypothetical protein [Paenibacillus polymyxa]WDZ55119.1 hypothetical protein MF622_10300 [Paenibacillus polymyxa]
MCLWIAGLRKPTPSSVNGQRPFFDWHGEGDETAIFLVQGQRMTLREVFQSLSKSNARGIQGSAMAHTTCGMPVRLIFVRNHSK